MTTFTVRTKDQLAVLLKLIEVNKIGLTRKNLSVRQRIWQVITQKLNEMQGAEKDVDGWKRCYNTWRLNAGTYFEQEKQRIIKDVADDDYFIINVSEEEFASETDFDDGANYLDPKDQQIMRLHELVSKHRLLFINSSEDDEPLKQRLWLNITDELNSISGGVKLPKKEWEKRVDLRKYAVRRGRKRKGNDSGTLRKSQNSSAGKAVRLDGEGNVKAESTDTYEGAYEEFIIEDFPVPLKPPAVEEITQADDTAANDMQNDVFAEFDDNDDDTDEIIKLLNEKAVDDGHEDIQYYDDGDNCEGADIGEDVNNERSPLTPIVKSFKLTNRIANAVEQLKDDMKETKDMLKQSTNTLNRMCDIMAENNKKQDETNLLLKRNVQLLKILVEYKCGLRTNK